MIELRIWWVSHVIHVCSFVFDPREFLFEINGYVTSNCSKLQFWSTFKLFELDQKRNFELIQSRDHLFRKEIRVDQKRNCMHVSHDFLLHILYRIKSNSSKNRNDLEKPLLVQFMENAIIESFFIESNFSTHQTW